MVCQSWFWRYNGRSFAEQKATIRAEAVRNCGHAYEPFALASGINRLPLDLAPGAKPDATPDASAFSSLEGVLQTCARKNLSWFTPKEVLIFHKEDSRSITL